MARSRAERPGVVQRGLALAEAACWLLLARVALSLIPFVRLAGLVSRPINRPELTGTARQAMRESVKRAVFHAWRRLPIENTCFHRALAAHAMLRRRGVGTTLCYGAATLPGRGLTGHVWLLDGDEFVVGRDAARECHLLARYPAGATEPEC